ncbi:MAG: cell division protein SepF [Defluviitaleaceae bacterium]|nr:cell division protein SepF [Defluviitaleaceae bacterium]
MGISLKKVSNFLLGADEDEYEDDDMEFDYEDEIEMNHFKPAVERKPYQTASRGSVVPRGRARENSNVRVISPNVVDMHKSSRTQIDIGSPKNIEDARDIIDNVKDDVISVVNLEAVDSPQAQRIADFLSGAVDALDGNIRRLSHDMFVITPSGVEVTGALAADIDDSIKTSGSSISLPWLSFGSGSK